MTQVAPTLTRSQCIIFLVYGVAGWFIAAMLLRYLGPLGIYDGLPRLWTYALIIPGTVPFVWLAGRLANTSKGQLFHGFSLSTAMATLCDGTAFALFPTLYGATVDLHLGAAGTILWGVGVGVFLALLMDRR